MEEVDSVRTTAEENINQLLENFMGINDTELGRVGWVVCLLRFFTVSLFTASQVWDLAEGKTNTMELAEAIDNSDLEAFGFTDDFIFELWGAITDAKSGRGKSMNNNSY